MSEQQVMDRPRADLLTITSYGRTAGSARVRVFDWLDWLSIDATSETYLDGSTNSMAKLAASPAPVIAAELRLRNLARAPDINRLLLSRQASPLSGGRLEERLLRRADHGVYDFDDALMHSPVGRLEAIWSKRRTWARSTAAADVVIAGNDYLADRASHLSGNVVTIPSCVDPGRYEVKLDYRIGDRPRAVWLGSPSTETYLQHIAPALVTLNESIGLRLTLISAGDADLGPLRPMADRVSWTLDGFSAELAKADFGIMPLDDNEWTRGKCAYKLLQYGASGLPLVGSPVGANADVLTGANGFAAENRDDWVSAIEALVAESTAAREIRGRKARETVQGSYSFSAWEDAWLDAMALRGRSEVPD